MSVRENTLDDYEHRLVETLQDIRDDLETVAETDVPFAENAEAALEWLDAHKEVADE